MRSQKLTCWGANIDGRSAVFTSEKTALAQLIHLTVALVKLRRCGWRMLARIVSTWTHHAMFAKAALCVFEESTASCAPRQDCGLGSC